MNPEHWIIRNTEAEALIQKAQEHARLWEYVEAFDAIREAIEQYPSLPDPHMFMALLCSWVDQHSEAITIIENLLRYAMDWPTLMLCASSIYVSAQEYAKADAIHDRIERMYGRNSQIFSNSAINIGMGQLRRGMWRQGFANWEHEYLERRRCWRATGDIPPWQGQRAKSKDDLLFLYYDQGFGDTIMWSRFLPQAKSMWGGRVELDVQPPLLRWAKTWRGLDDVYATGDPFWFPPHAAYKLSVAGLAFACGVTTDTEVEKGHLLGTVGEVRPEQDRFNVGICWRGSDEFTNNAFRSIPWDQFRTLLDDMPDVRWHSFQVGKYEDECGDDPRVVKLYPVLKDYLDTCERLNGMDLVISVDTSVINACGAIGKKGWCLVWNPIEVRWGMPGKDRWVWYPAIKPYWRAPGMSWQPALERVRADLSESLTLWRRSRRT